MVRKEAFAFFALALGLSRDPGCGDVDDPNGGTNAPCTRNSDCKSGLSCSAGVCTDPNAKDGGPRDASDED